MKNKFILRLILLLVVGMMFQACKKDDFTPVDMSELNPDEPLKNTDLDKWLEDHFLEPYNSEVIYHYHRYYHEADRNVSPPNIDMVKPMMETVLDGYIDPYLDVAGEEFVKENLPKQWVLYGSTSYDASGIGYAGTASGGVRINLFGLNNFSLTPGFVKGRLHIIHHEFTHILNQRFIMPADFQEITKSTYNGDWTNTDEDSAHAWGYVSAYASENPTEDYAETTSALLVNGQSWFDHWVLTSPSSDGQHNLRLKEQNVVEYFNSSLNIDFRELQKEVQLYLINVLDDHTVTFPYWLDQGLYKTITISAEDAIYSQYPMSQEFIDDYQMLKDAILAVNSGALYTLDYIQFRFESPTDLVVRTAFTAAAGGSEGTQYYGDFSFSVSVDQNTGETHFTKIAQASGTTFDNGGLFINAFENTIQKYLTDHTFMADWLPEDAPASEFTKTGGFTVKDDVSNYIYGPLGESLDD